MTKTIELTQNEISELKRLLKTHLTNEKVILFGSRINGHFHLHSDLDLAIIADEKLSWQLISNLRDGFENTSFAFRIDFLDYHRISNEFKKVIIETGILFKYQE